MLLTLSRALCLVALSALAATAAAQSPPTSTAAGNPALVSADSVDPRTFRISIDGVNRAFGDTLGPLAPGPHRITARICTVRGACADLSTTISVTALPETPSPPSLLSRALDLLIDVIRRLITP